MKWLARQLALKYGFTVAYAGLQAITGLGQFFPGLLFTFACDLARYPLEQIAVHGNDPVERSVRKLGIYFVVPLPMTYVLMFATPESWAFAHVESLWGAMLYPPYAWATSALQPRLKQIFTGEPPKEEIHMAEFAEPKEPEK